jgi:phage-related protein
VAGKASLIIDIVVNSAKAQAELAGTAKATGGFSKGLSKMVAPAAAVVGAVAGIAAASVKAASDVQQSFGGIEAVFGKNADQVKGWANGAAKTVGLSANSYAEFATKIGGSLKNAGFPMDQVAKKTNDMITMGADLAATYGGTTADAVDALGAAMRGEADPAEKYALNLKQSQVNAQMAADGTDKLTGKAKTQAQAQAVLELATQQSAVATGRFASESDTAAGSSQIAAAQFENAKAALGTSLLPTVVAAAEAFGKFASFIQKNADVIMPIVIALGAMAAVILIVAAAQWVWNSAIFAFPGTWIALAVIALVVGIVLLWKKCDGFRNAMIAAWNAIKAAFSATVGFVKAAVAWIVMAANTTKNAFVTAWNFVKAVVAAVFGWISARVQAFANLVRAVANAVKSAFSAAWNAVKSAVGAAVAYVMARVRQIQQIASSVASAVRSAFSNAWNSVKSAASAMASYVMSAIRRPLSAATSVASSIRNAFTNAFNALRGAASGLAGALSAPFHAIAGAINGVISAVQSLIGWLSRIHVPKISLPKGATASSAAVGSPAGVRVAGGARVSQTGAHGATTHATAGGVTVNVTGALDPESVARQIEKILTGAKRRRTGVVLSQRAPGLASA